eukprot:5097477-Pleurochrysis_carterae.AAC.2
MRVARLPRRTRARGQCALATSPRREFEGKQACRQRTTRRLQIAGVTTRTWESMAENASKARIRQTRKELRQVPSPLYPSTGRARWSASSSRRVRVVPAIARGTELGCRASAACLHSGKRSTYE